MVTIHTTRDRSPFVDGGLAETIMLQREDVNLGIISTVVAKDLNIREGRKAVQAIVAALRFTGQVVVVTGTYAGGYK